MSQNFPIARPGMRIGLLGGSFDPAHQGHAHISRVALRRFGLDQVWWLLSPGNPLKAKGPAPLAARMRRAREVMPDPRIKITDLEQRLGTCFTADTLRALQAHYRQVDFVWLMGADNLIQIDRWDHWQDIFDRMPVGVLARPGVRLRARCSKAARVFAHAKLPGWRSQELAAGPAPRWCFINMPMSSESSTRIRDAGDWKSPAREA
ncbi:nicotinate-nucleotide adenylyltransferase [Thioclava sp. GXIMD4216]|uniref:Probable nicotinate-nucleotide adenylyltransferase n=1 Tax=Thioclava litoralis TaxID=3076557 RepID=A0ABZ1E2D1_9RHOB|nr:nicotinate-nucleotide adenylyltransferase [Thioclava sp. FTW29]